MHIVLLDSGSLRVRRIAAGLHRLGWAAQVRAPVDLGRAARTEVLVAPLDGVNPRLAQRLLAAAPHVRLAFTAEPGSAIGRRIAAAGVAPVIEHTTTTAGLLRLVLSLDSLADATAVGDVGNDLERAFHFRAMWSWERLLRLPLPPSARRLRDAMRDGAIEPGGERCHRRAPTSGSAWLELDGSLQPVRMRDLSLGGLGVREAEPAVSGRVGRVIASQAETGWRYTFPVRVVWSQPGLGRLGLCFVGIPARRPEPAAGW